MEERTGSQMFRVSPEEARSKQVNPSENFDTADIDNKISRAMQRANLQPDANPERLAAAERLKSAQDAQAKAEAEAEARLERRSRWRKAVIIAAVVAVVVIVLTKKEG